ncbi:hypothetical protein RJ55_04241 [Drechmeria coniospora]|nr:hypothetical protein RJ55_04241 [Drechmeria coniospora]
MARPTDDRGANRTKRPSEVSAKREAAGRQALARMGCWWVSVGRSVGGLDRVAHGSTRGSRTRHRSARPPARRHSQRGRHVKRALQPSTKRVTGTQAHYAAPGTSGRRSEHAIVLCWPLPFVGAAPGLTAQDSSGWSPEVGPAYGRRRRDGTSHDRRNGVRRRRMDG